MFILGGFFVFCSKVKAADIIWDNSEVRVISNHFEVNPWDKLIIEPGTIIKIAANGYIASHGDIVAMGNADNPIVFTSLKDDSVGGDTNNDGNATAPAMGDWGYIFIGGEGKHVTMDYVEIHYAGNNGYNRYVSFINVSSYGEPQQNLKEINITHSSITNNFGGISFYGEAIFKISESNFYNDVNCPLPTNWDPVWLRCDKLNIGHEGNVAVEAPYVYWGHPEGPTTTEDYYNGIRKGTGAFGDINYQPFLIEPWPSTLTNENESNPVIIVPGILGSYLNRNEAGSPEVWPNVIQMILSLDDSYLNELVLMENGWPDFSDNLIATDIIRKISSKDFFEGLITELTNNGYKEGENLFVFSYDWRLDIDWLAGDSPLPNHQGLKEKIEEIKATTGADKVDIIAHSMGGLVVKKYLQKYGNSSLDKFIDIATPHLGAPKAFKALMYGDDMDFIIADQSLLNSERLQYISQNMPAIYQLLPSQEYFNISDFNIPDPNYENYIYDIHDLDANGVKGALNYSQTQEFMKNTGRNSDLLALSDNFHQEIDNLSVPNTFSIVGCGSSTIGKIYILNKEKSGGFEYALKYISGDSTVPLRSAEVMDSSKIYIRGSGHANIPSAEGAKQLVASILKGEQANFNFSAYPNLSLNKDICSFSGTQISYHSPIELHIYDENNNHLGPNENGDIEMGIAGASYDIIEGNKFAFLPIGHTYRIVGEATASGSFNARIENINNAEYTQTVYYNEVPLQTAQAEVSFNIYDGQNSYPMAVDNEGDGSVDAEILPSAILNEGEADDLIKPQTNINILGEEGNGGWLIGDAQIELAAQDNEGGAGILKTEYSLDNGQTWNIYQAAFTLSEEGEHKILYASTDRAGNVEEIKEANIKIDKNGPVIQFILPTQDQKFLHSEIFNIAYSAADSYSGVASNTLMVWLDSEEIDASQTIDLFNLPLGEHYLKINLADEAGNISAAEARFIIAATIESVISDINRSYQEGMIIRKLVRDDLIAKLKIIQQYIKKHEKKYKQFILKQYQLILKELAFYYRKGWINREGYDIIKADINYLIHNL